MSQIKPNALIESMSGKICGHSDMYFFRKNGKVFSGKICNPSTKEPTAAQQALRAVTRSRGCSFLQPLVVVVVLEAVVGVVGVAAKALFEGLPPVEDLRFTPVDMTPIEDEQPSEEQAA